MLQLAKENEEKDITRITFPYFTLLDRLELWPYFYTNKSIWQHDAIVWRPIFSESYKEKIKSYYQIYFLVAY